MDYKISYREKDKGIQCIINYKNENGEWKQKSKQGFKTQKESKDWQEKTLKALKKELEDSVKLNAKYKGISFKEFEKIFLEELSIYKEPGTVKTTKTALNKFSELDGVALEKIEFLNIKKIVNDMVKEGLKPVTIEHYIVRLKVMLDSAVDDYKAIPTSPLSANKITLLPEKEVAKMRVLTDSELANLIDIITPSKDRMIVILASKCGLRAGELVGLTWDAVDLKNLDLYVNKQWKKLKSGEYGFGSLKTKNSYRKVPISASVVAELEEYKKNSPREMKNNRLFVEKNTSNVCTRLRLKFKKLGFDNSLHDLRHTYATHLIAAGIDFKTVSAYMGDTVNMVIKTYAHFTDDMYEAGRAKINNL